MIASMAFPAAYSRRILYVVSNTTIPISPPDTRQADSLHHRDEGSLFDADPQVGLWKYVTAGVVIDGAAM